MAKAMATIVIEDKQSSCVWHYGARKMAKLFAWFTCAIFFSLTRVLVVLYWSDLSAISRTTDEKVWRKIDINEISTEGWNEVHFIQSNAIYRCQRIGEKEFNDRWNDLHFKRASSLLMCLWSNSPISHLFCFMKHSKFITCKTSLLYAEFCTDQIQWHSTFNIINIAFFLPLKTLWSFHYETSMSDIVLWIELLFIEYLRQMNEH